MLALWSLVVQLFLPFLIASAEETIGGLPLGTEVSDIREILAERTTINETTYFATYTEPISHFTLSLLCDAKHLRVFENTVSQNITCSLAYSSAEEMAVSVSSDYPVAVALPPTFSISKLPPTPVPSNQNLTIPISTFQIGDAYIILRVKSGLIESLALGVKVVVLRRSGIVDLIFRVGLITLLFIATFLMGCEADLDVIKSYAKRPIGPVIGFLCQFLIMPMVSMVLAKLTPISSAFGFGLLVSGCCPGGGASNVWTRLLGGDLNLSLSMTLFSSLAAVGMLPLLLFAFARFFTTIDTSAIPYGLILVNLLYLFIPVSGGLLVRYFRPSLAARLRRGVQPTSCLFLVYVVGFGTFANLSIYGLMARYPLLIAVASALPITGYVLGLISALLCCRSWPIAVAISIETGVQNVGIAILILIYAIPQPLGDLGAVMPIIVAISTPIFLLPVVVCRGILRRFRSHGVVNNEECSRNWGITGPETTSTDNTPFLTNGLGSHSLVSTSCRL